MVLFFHPASEIPNPFLVFVSQTADKKWTASSSLQRKTHKEYTDYVRKPTELWTSLVQIHCKAEECSLSKMYVRAVVEFRSCFQTCNNIALNFKAKKNVICCLCTVDMRSRYRTSVLYWFCFRAPLAVLPCPSGPQTWKGMETRSGYSRQPQKSSVRMYRNIKTPRHKWRSNQGGKRAAWRKHSPAVRGDCKKRAGLQLSRVGRLSTTMSRKLKSIKPSLHLSSLSWIHETDTWETRAASVSSTVGRARPPTVKEQPAKYLVKLNVVPSVTCCFIPGCFEKVTEASSGLSAALLGIYRRQGRCREGTGTVLIFA